jgi:acyl carrier protein
MSTTLDRLRLLLSKDYKLDPAMLLPDVPLEDLGIDSLGVAELMFNIEDEFKIAIPGEPVVLKTVGDVAGYIDGLIATQHADAAAESTAALRTVPGR